MKSDLTYSAVRQTRCGFSLVEMLASVAIIGIIAFLAIPSVSRMREDSERNLAIARAESLNVAQATMVQMKGRTSAQQDWTNAGNDDQRYLLLAPYMSYAEATRSLYLPSGYLVQFDPSIVNMKKVRLFDPESRQVYY